MQRRAPALNIYRNIATNQHARSGELGYWNKRRLFIVPDPVFQKYAVCITSPDPYSRGRLSLAVPNTNSFYGRLY